MAKKVELQPKVPVKVPENQPRKRGRKPGQKNKKKKATGKIEWQLFGELLVIDLTGVQIKKVMLTNGSGKETFEHV